MTFPFFLSRVAKGFGLVGGEDDVATGGALVCCLAGVAAAPNVAAEGDPIVFQGEDKGDFGNGELGPLGSVSREVESERSFNGLTARAFCLIPFGASSGEDDFSGDHGIGWR